MFGLSTENIVVGTFVFFNLSTICFLVYMLLRILKEQENTHHELSLGTHDLIEAGHKLHSMYALAESLANNNSSGPRNYLSEGLEQSLSELSDSVITESLNKLERTTSEMKTLVQDLLSTPTEHLPAWKETHNNKIEMLLATNESLAPEITKLQTTLDQTVKEVKRLGLKIFEPDNSAATQPKLETYQKMLMQARERARVAENSLMALEAEALGFKNKMETSLVETNEIIANQQLEISKMRNEKNSLTERMIALENELKRTNIEKGFIEDKFIELS